MTNNTLKNDILALFDDNHDNEISASDMRLYIEAIFDSKEELVVKVSSLGDLPSSNTNIFEGSLVVVYNDGDNTGLYLSKINQPVSLDDIYKI